MLYVISALHIQTEIDNLCFYEELHAVTFFLSE